MRSGKSIPFTADLIAAALAEISDPCSLVFPTKVSAALAQKRFLPQWQLQDCAFLSMDELKRDLILPPQPTVSEDKRLICLYQVLEPEDRDYFHISGYFDIVQWGNLFFQFFDELCDECYEAEDLLELNASGIFHLLGWQDEYIQRIMAVRARYASFLAASGFTDPIFYTSAGRIQVPWQGRRFIFVNQYYYSKLEKRMLDALEAAGNELVILSQSADPEFDPVALLPPQIRLEELTADDCRTERIEVVETENEDQMILAFLGQPASEKETGCKRKVIIDRHFHSKHYSRLFSPDRFQLPPSRSLVESNLYALVLILQRHLEALEASRQQRFIPLRLILDACSQLRFLNLYQPEWGKAELELVLAELRSLINEDILYLDKELKVLEAVPKKLNFKLLPLILIPHFDLLDRLTEVDSPRALGDFLDGENGIGIRELCSRDEIDFSDILEKIYERLANFLSLDHLELVSSWSGFFGCSGAALTARILQLFLEALAGDRFRFDTLKEGDPEYAISNLLDSRDLSYDQVVFFHAIEGEIPTNPTSVWLFNEAQRSQLGLKSYPGLRERERYYFLRLIFTAKQARIHCYRNQDKDIEPGSFVTELKHLAREDEVLEAGGEGTRRIEFSYQPLRLVLSQLYRSRLLAYPVPEGKGGIFTSNPACGLDTKDPQPFFTLPGEPERDFPQRVLKASHYSLAQLLMNPFVWYIRHLSKLQRTPLRQQESISRKLFGNIMHAFLARILTPLATEHKGLGEVEKVFNNPLLLRQKLLDLLNPGQAAQPDKSLFLYQIPQNYNHEFLLGIILDSLVESVQQFYQDYLRIRLHNRSFRLIPEKLDTQYDDSDHKQLAEVIFEEKDYAVLIKGRADLRIECPQEYIIVDFKTGQYDDSQLIFYQWFYYLLSGDYDQRKITSQFWGIFDRVAKPKSIADKKIQSWKLEIANALDACLESGFPPGRTAKDRKTWPDITRADLYRIQFGGGS